jgi:DNA-directed RNA polymerase specialized sigma24 family protein
VIGVDRDTAEDIAQEVALRALASGLEYSDEEDFCRWAFTVARNLHIDNARLRARVTTVVELPDKWDGRDVATEVEQRMRLSRTFAAMKTMRESDRKAIVDGLTTSSRTSRTVAVRLAVRRHRARARLLRLVEGVGAVWLWLRYPARPEVAVQLAAAASAAVIAGPAVLGAGHDGSAGRAYAASAPQVLLRDRTVGLSRPALPGPATGTGGTAVAGPSAYRRSGSAPAARPAATSAPGSTSKRPVEVDRREKEPDDCVFQSGELPDPVPTCWNPPEPGPEPEPPANL